MEVQENKTFISLCERCTPCLTASRSPSIPCEPEGIQIWFCSDDTLPGAALLLGVPDSLLPSAPPQGGLCSGAVPGSGKFSCSCWTVTGFEVLACDRCRPWGPWGPMAAAVWDPRGSFCVVSGLLWGPSTQSPIRFWPFACTQSWVLPLLHPTQCVHHLPVPVSILRLPLGKLTSLLQFRAPTVHPAPGLFLGRAPIKLCLRPSVWARAGCWESGFGVQPLGSGCRELSPGCKHKSARMCYCFWGGRTLTISIT